MSQETMTRRNALIGENYQIAPFSELPRPHQLAMAWYMAVDGDAWHCPALEDIQIKSESSKKEFEALMPFFVEHYGTTPFGITTITAQQAKDALMGDDDISEDHASWDEYHAWYTSGQNMPQHSKQDRWPVILSGFEGESFQDGHHRLHSYLRDGHPDVPVIFYPERKHLAELIKPQTR